MMTTTTERDAYLQAEVVTALAHQIRAIRSQRGWTQLDLAKRLGTTQAAVSRLEDPSYGRLTLKTLMDLSRVFDTGLQVKFVSFITMLHETFHPKLSARYVPSFEDEAPYVGFYSHLKRINDTLNLPAPSTVLTGGALKLNVPSHSRFIAINEPIVSQTRVTTFKLITEAAE